MQNSNGINWKKYFFSFVITAVIFFTAILISNYFSQKKTEDIRNIQDKIAIDILSTENHRGFDDPEVQILKKYYFLLEIKDYLLMNKISEKCKKTPLSVVYFYSNDKRCTECEKEGFVLTRLRELYPELRVYSFDYDADLSAVKTFIRINNIEDRLPAIIIKSKTYYGFRDIEDLEKAVPELTKLKIATSTPLN